jgi:Fe-S cluster assembly scaffold protein SufB
MRDVTKGGPAGTLQPLPLAEPDLSCFDSESPGYEYVNDLSGLDKKDAAHFLNVGVDASENLRIGTYIQKDMSVVHCKARQEGVEVLPISQALDRHGWLDQYMWRGIRPDKDRFTRWAGDRPSEGYFIRSREGVACEAPVQACLYIAKEKFSQNVHNVVIAEPGSALQIITGCATAPHLVSGLHVGVSEFYVKKGARLMFTMIHEWGGQVAVRPRTMAFVEEGGVLVSNYISLRPLGTLQMAPTTHLVGPGSVARFQSVLVASKNSHLDVGSNVILDAPGARAEIISRAITYGGNIIARGKLVGRVPDIRAHLECKGLILKDGLMHAIPELEAHVPGVEMSHEAAVGKIDKAEIEYLMARGLTEEAAVSTIVRGFLNVHIEGLPPLLRERLDRVIQETEKDMF